MQINENIYESSKKTFKELNPGDVFKYRNYYYMKTEELNFNNGTIINAVIFNEGDLCFFDNSTKVLLCEDVSMNVTIKIERNYI